MRFSYAESMTDPTYYLPLAEAVEAAGYSSFIVPDSIAYPEVSDSTYPYTPDGSREFLDGKPFIEPFSLIPAMGAVTETLRFTTFVVKLPIRHPVLVAKQASSVAVMTNNRFGFGIGTSPWPEDYDICDVPWERRGKRMDEMMDIIRGLTDPENVDGFFGYDGEIFQVQPLKMSPKPTEPIPLLIGGHGDRALRRAAEKADGWMHGGGPPEELERCLGELQRLREEAGTADRPFEIHVISFDAWSVDGVHRLEDLGITDCIVGFRDAYQVPQDTQPLQEKIDAINQFAEDVISKA
jgi:probable F420-dependent oxidoreductase